MYNKPSGENCTLYFFSRKLTQKAFMHFNFSAFLIFLMKNYLRAKMLLFNIFSTKDFSDLLHQLFIVGDTELHKCYVTIPPCMTDFKLRFARHKSGQAALWIDVSLYPSHSCFCLFGPKGEPKPLVKNIERAACNTGCIWRKRKWIQ